MYIRSILFVFIASIFFGCKNKVPFKPDYEVAEGVIIGVEICKNNQSANAWLVQFSGPNAGGKSYGEKIAYNGVVYNNVLKTYQLPDSSKVSGKRFFFEFYLDGKSNQQICDITNPITFNIEEIRIINILTSRN
ncbi:hypothetical protein ACFOWA_01025 [Pedobacter lithocola]|uniref:DUF4377 domain-containing protein n=1 Tax=Pedobacter lithocola TaxID=1908239 RepID=A0ABV8P6T7_9SPHI